MSAFDKSKRLWCMHSTEYPCDVPGRTRACFWKVEMSWVRPSAFMVVSEWGIHRGIFCEVGNWGVRFKVSLRGQGMISWMLRSIGGKTLHECYFNIRKSSLENRKISTSKSIKIHPVAGPLEDWLILMCTENVLRWWLRNSANQLIWHIYTYIYCYYYYYI